MAEPAFIYAFDNLGPYQFTKLCGELLGSRYNGFMLGGEGADGGIDAEIDNVLGVWYPEQRDSIEGDIINPNQTVTFQFKHKVTARVGQSQTRIQLLNLYKCHSKTHKVCELHSKLVQGKKPFSYILVTNVEVNSQFRSTFIKQCQQEEPDIKHYQVIGLDELVSWVALMPELRHLYFPTIFGIPRFDLRVTSSHSFLVNREGDIDTSGLGITAANVGSITSFLDANAIKLICVVNGKEEELGLYLGHDVLRDVNPDPVIGLEPGRSKNYFVPPICFETARKLAEGYFHTEEEIFPVEIQLVDEIGNRYVHRLNKDKRDVVMKYMYSSNG